MTEQAGPRYLHVPEPHTADVRTLLSLNAEQLRKVTEAMRSKENLQSELPPLESLMRAAGLSPAEALAIWSTVPNLTRQRVLLTDDEFFEDLKAIAPALAEGMEGDKKGALLDLLSESDEGHLLQKADFLRTGFIPSFVSSRSICDLRPLFDKKHEAIEGAALVVLLGITTDDDQHRSRTIVVQLTPEKLRQLRQTIEDAEKKLDLMKARFKADMSIF